MFDGQKVCAIIAAAGKSQRMGGYDKLFVRLMRKPVIYWSISSFNNSSAVDEIIVVSSAGNIKKVQNLVKKYHLSKVKAVLPGGRRRQDSVKAGLEATTGCYWAMVHDGARPLVTNELIESVLSQARKTGAAICGLQVCDTVKTARDGRVIKTLSRQNLFSVQTPQAFSYSILLHAYNLTGADVTDDAQLVEKSGVTVSLVPGSYDNIKITTPQDLELAKIIMNRRGG